MLGSAALAGCLPVWTNLKGLSNAPVAGGAYAIMTARPIRVAGFVGLFALCLSVGCTAPDRESVEFKRELFENCASCHGDNGGGNAGPALRGHPELAVPAIAGMEPWYLKSQLRKFQRGIRGTHTDDFAGKRMRPMALDLSSDENLQLVAAYVAGLPSQRPQAVLNGDAEKGKILYAPCTACHGLQGEGKLELRAPALTNSSDWYIVEQLKKFKAGVRGTHPQDVTGAQMRPMSMLLADEQAMKDVAAYIQTLAE